MQCIQENTLAMLDYLGIGHAVYSREHFDYAVLFRSFMELIIISNDVE